MGTFHDTKDPLHGVTVVALSGTAVYVGRCHERDEQHVVLVDADQHEDGQNDLSNAEYLATAARFGVWKKHERIVLPTAEIDSLAPLSDYYRHPDSTPAADGRMASISPLAAPAAPASVSAATSAATSAAMPPASRPVTLSDGARIEILRLLADPENRGRGLRLGVAGGGCSGLVYKVDFDTRQVTDVVVPEDGFEIYLDPKSAIYLRGVTLDFTSGLAGRGFQFSNPNASNSCGCGESFAV